MHTIDEKKTKLEIGKEKVMSTTPLTVENAKIIAGTEKARVVIRIGHIGAIGALPNEDKILNISRMQLFDEGLLGTDLDFE